MGLNNNQDHFGGKNLSSNPADDNTLSRLKHLHIHAGSHGNKKNKRGQRATTGGDRNGRGLRQFSLKVCEKVESKGRTTYNEVADELVAELSDPRNGVQPAGQQQYDEKNIRRRVYDALNVLMAMDIITKDKKEIHWKGLPQTGLNHIQELKSERLAIQNRFELKSAYLQELEDQYVAVQNLIQHNQQLYGSQNAPPGGYALPFVLVQTPSHAEVNIEMSDDMQLFHFDFNGTPFELHYDVDVLKEMKLCGRSKGGDDMANGGSVDDMATGGATIPSGRPPLHGTLKARVPKGVRKNL